jgi:two-component system sensor histidine kinase/response regulator
LSFARTPLPSIRAKLYTLVLACAVPVLIGYAALVRDAGLRERIHTASDARTVAEVLAAAVDRDIESGETAGQVLAGIPIMARGDFAQIHAVRRMLRPEFVAQAFVLSLPDGTAARHPPRLRRGAAAPR